MVRLAGATLVNDMRVRKAIAYAVNVDKIIEEFCFGRAARQYGVIPTGVWDSNNDLKGYDYDFWSSSANNANKRMSMLACR